MRHVDAKAAAEVPPIGIRAPEEHHDFSDLTLPELRDLWAKELAPKWDAGTCCCPVFSDGSRGFRQACVVHGGRDRRDFARLTALRAEIYSRMRAPASVTAWDRGRRS